MAGVDRFKDLEAWRIARVLTKEIYGLTRQGPISKDFGLRDQIQRAAVSVMSNIAEGFGYNSNKQFAHFLDVAGASAYEVQSLLFVALDAGLIAPAAFDQYFVSESILLNVSTPLVLRTISPFRGERHKLNKNNILPRKGRWRVATEGSRVLRWQNIKSIADKVPGRYLR